MNARVFITSVIASSVIGIGCSYSTEQNRYVCFQVPDYSLGGTGGEDGTNSASSSGGGCGENTSTDSGSCAVPQLGYNPGLVPNGQLLPTDDTIGDIEASRLAPFANNTTCQTVIVGLSKSEESCEIPAALELVVPDSGTILPSSVPSLFEVIPITEEMLFSTASLGAYELRIPLVTTHVAGLYPIVGARLRSNVCPLLMPWCDHTRSIAHDENGWEEQEAGQLYFGLSDCATP